MVHQVARVLGHTLPLQWPCMQPDTDVPTRPMRPFAPRQDAFSPAAQPSTARADARIFSFPCGAPYPQQLLHVASSGALIDPWVRVRAGDYVNLSFGGPQLLAAVLAIFVPHLYERVRHWLFFAANAGVLLGTALSLAWTPAPLLQWGGASCLGRGRNRVMVTYLAWKSIVVLRVSSVTGCEAALDPLLLQRATVKDTLCLFTWGLTAVVLQLVQVRVSTALQQWHADTRALCGSFLFRYRGLLLKSSLAAGLAYCRCRHRTSCCSVPCCGWAPWRSSPPWTEHCRPSCRSPSARLMTSTSSSATRCSSTTSLRAWACGRPLCPS